MQLSQNDPFVTPAGTPVLMYPMILEVAVLQSPTSLADAGGGVEEWIPIIYHPMSYSLNFFKGIN